MTHSIAPDAPRRKVVVGVDTHKYVHVAVAVDTFGVRLEHCSFTADSAGYAELIGWAEAQGPIEAFGIEGTGSYGAGLASAVRRRGHRAVEVNRGDRRSRRANGKSDTLDAESAARAVLAGTATAVPKTGDGQVEMMRQVKAARDTAVKARTSAMITLKQIVVNAPAELRERLGELGDKALIDRCAGFRPGPVRDTTASAKHTLRALARRWLDLNAEVVDHDRVLDSLTADLAPTLRDGFGVGPDTVAELLIVFGDNPDRVRSESAFAAVRRLPRPRLHGRVALPPSLPRRAPPGELGSLPRRHRPDAVPPADHRLCRPPHRGGHAQTGGHPLPQALPRPRDLPARHGRPPCPRGHRDGGLNARLGI